MTTTDSLTAQLVTNGFLKPEWRAAFDAVPREWFVPSQVWVDDEDGQPAAIDRDTDPDAWLAAVRSNRPILTQFDDGQTRWPATTGLHCTCSASQPEYVLAMLDALDVHPGDRVLEIGTGTGYNAALLAARVGAGNVTTIEVDPGLADAARTALANRGFQVNVVCADGASGYPPGKPFDRVIATAAVWLEELPPAWVEHCRAGGMIVTPVRPDFDGSGALVRYLVHGGGQADGRPIGRVGFMPLRQHRTDDVDPAVLVASGASVRQSVTRLKPWRLVGTWETRWAIGASVRDCRWHHDPPQSSGGEHVLWLTDPRSGSWASAHYTGSAGTRIVRQAGPRSLWDEVESAFRTWKAAGKPPPDQWILIVSATGQQTRISEEPTAAMSVTT